MPDPEFAPPLEVTLPDSITNPVDILSLKAQMTEAINTLDPGTRGAFIAGVRLNGALHMAVVEKISEHWAFTADLAKAKNQGWSGGAQVMASW